MENPIDVLLPSSDRIFIFLLVEESRNWVPFTLLDVFLLDVGHGPTMRPL